MTHDSLILDIEEHPFAQYVRILGKGKKGSRSLTEQEAFDAMNMILKGECEDLQLGAFLMLLRVKEESAEELSGFVKAVKDNINAPSQLSVDLDWSSYAGKRRHLPWFLFSILLLAKSGVKILIHGASGHTSNRLYTEDTMRKLGLPICENWSECESQLASHNFSYAPLRIISPRLADMIDMRNTLGLRSPVHSLSRLINPLDAKHVLQGIFHPPYSGLHQSAAGLLGYENLGVIKGEGGEIERNPDNELTTYYARDGELSEEQWPKLFARRHVKAQDMTVDYMKKLWQGELNDEYAEAAITSTAALALHLMNKGTMTQEQALENAKEMWEGRDKEALLR